MVKDFNFKHFAYPISIWKLKRFLNRTEAWSKDKLIEYQTERLKRIIKYAYDYVPYYKQLFDENGISPEDILSIDDMQLIPPLTKDIIRERFDDLTSTIYKRFDPVLTQTSGSTGTPLKLYLDKHINTARFAYYWRIWGWTGYRLGQRWATIRGSIFESGKIFEYAKPMNALYISSYKITEENSKVILDELLKFNPKMLRGYPASLYELAKFICSDSRVENLKLNNIICDAEKLEDFQKSFLQNTFNVSVYDSYGQWEHVCLIGECEYQRKHHQMEYGILELLDENNKIVKDGSLGEITATGFYNLAMPLVRYKTRDLAIKGNGSCACGRSHDLIDTIEGRHEDVIITPEGRHIGLMSTAFYFNKGFDFARIIQNEVTSIDVLLVKNKYYNEDEEKILEHHIRKRVGNTIKINFKSVDKIDKDSSGKCRFTKNNIFANKKWNKN